MQIHITAKRKLVISGERKSDLHAGWVEKVQERQFGDFQREFVIADDADFSSILQIYPWCFNGDYQEEGANSWQKHLH